VTECKTALVTGATGFIGSAVTSRLIAEGWTVHIIQRPTSRVRTFDGDVRVHSHDGTTESMRGIVREANPSVVFHMASLVQTWHRPEDVEPMIRSNVLFGTQLLEAMALNGVSLIVNTGTAGQHYMNEVYNPASLYAATKQAFETIAVYYEKTAAIKVITLKLNNVYGPFDRTDRLFSLFEQSTRERKTIDMSPGEQLIDLTYIEDVADAFLSAAERLLSGKCLGAECYAVSSGRAVSLQVAAALYERISGRKLKIRWGAIPYRKREMMTPWRQGESLPGWQPRTALEDGIRLTIDTAIRGHSI
jgi:nucleoside-diphosphate-sugar epimerase